MPDTLRNQRYGFLKDAYNKGRHEWLQAYFGIRPLEEFVKFYDTLYGSAK